MPKVYTANELAAYIARQFREDTPDIVRKVNTWLSRGDGVAIYENCDLGALDVGASKIVSYGSPVSMLETDEVPANMPDTRAQINWRYLLHATYRGTQLDMPSPDTYLPAGTPAREAYDYARYLSTHGYTISVWRYRTALDNYGPASQRTHYADGYAVRYDGRLIRDDGSQAEYATSGLTVFCEATELPLTRLIESRRALVSYGDGYIPMYVAAYNPRETETQRDQNVNPGMVPTVTLHELGPSDMEPDGPHRFFHLHLTEIPAS